MKYGSKKEAKKWSLDTLGKGGLIATIPTPFKEDDLSVDENGLRALVRYVKECRNDGIFITGNVGEFFSMTVEERKKVVEIVCDEAGDELIVVAQTAHHCAQDCIDMSLHAEEAGADLVAIISPYFQSPTEEACENWWHYVCDKFDIGVVFYDSPLATLVSPRTLGRLSREIPNIAGVKDGRPDLSWSWEAERACNYEIWVSDPLEDHWPLEMKVMKNPCMCTNWHLYLLQEPGYTPLREYTDLIMAGKWEEGLKKYNEVEPGRQLLNEFFWPNYRRGVYVVGYWKYWLKMKGLPISHRVRPPLLDLTIKEQEWLAERVKKVMDGTYTPPYPPVEPYSLQSLKMTPRNLSN